MLPGLVDAEHDVHEPDPADRAAGDAAQQHGAQGRMEEVVRVPERRPGGDQQHHPDEQ